MTRSEYEFFDSQTSSGDASPDPLRVRVLDVGERTGDGATHEPTSFQRGWEAGCRSLTQAIMEAMKPTRKGGIPRIDVYRFDAIVERHLSEVGIPRGPDDAERYEFFQNDNP
jgi:hypothetical protein